MSIKLWNPFQELARLEQDITKAFESSTAKTGFFSPLTDLKETNEEIIIDMNVPGMKSKDIQIEATPDYIEIKAEKSEKPEKENEKNENGWTARHIERRTEKLYRKIHFNVPVDAQNAKLKLENGVLHIEIPKQPESKKVQLKIE